MNLMQGRKGIKGDRSAKWCSRKSISPDGRSLGGCQSLPLSLRYLRLECRAATIHLQQPLLRVNRLCRRVLTAEQSLSLATGEATLIPKYCYDFHVLSYLPHRALLDGVLFRYDLELVAFPLCLIVILSTLIVVCETFESHAICYFIR